MAKRSGTIRGRISGPPAGIDAGPAGEFAVDFGFVGEGGLISSITAQGISDSPKGIFACWFFLSGTNVFLLSIDNATAVNGALRIFIDNSNRILITTDHPSGGFDPITFVSAQAALRLNTGRWHHLVVSWDIDSEVLYCYVDDLDVWTAAVSLSFTTGETVYYNSADDNIDFFGSSEIGAPLLNCAAQVWFAPGQFLDLTVEANRRKFINEHRMPVALGPDGSNPTGIAPIIYFDNPFQTININRGTGPDFSIFGTLGDCDQGIIFPGGNGGPAGIYATDFQPTGSEGGFARTTQNIVSLANTKFGLVSFWIIYEGSGQQTVWLIDRATVNPVFEVNVTSGGQLQVVGLTSASVMTLDFLSDPVVLVNDGAWHHVVFSFDLNATSVFHCYINDTDVWTNADTLTLADNAIGWDRNPSDVWEIGGGTNITMPWEGGMAQIYINTEESLDLTVEENRRKFITSSGGPVGLGITGLLPTGNRPMHYFDNPAATMYQNRGNAGNFTISGTLDDYSSTPAD